jgi:N-methylhydantoinase A
MQGEVTRKVQPLAADFDFRERAVAPAAHSAPVLDRRRRIDVEQFGEIEKEHTNRNWRVGIDVGGTFTDLFAWNERSGERRTTKVLTTNEDRSEGVIATIAEVGIPFGEISHLMHGSTTATNSLIERSYPDAAMVSTEGFRDVIETGRQHRQRLYDPYQTKPKPIIRRRHRYVVPERMGVNGEPVKSLDRTAARIVADKIRDSGVRSIAVCFINSYVNDAHERQMRDILLEMIPEASVVTSAETRPVFREHGRFITAAVRAVIIPVMADYFTRLREELSARGFTGSLLILKSNGGIMGVELAKEHPEELIESGPAGGVAYAKYLSGLAPNIIHTDMGGTSFDVSIVESGRGLVTRNYELEWDVPIVVPMLDIHSVGAGGGSIGWIDDGGSLRVGPHSAGAEPGPACYCRGGSEATITDANLLLGRLDPTLGGKFPLDRGLSEKAIARLADRMGMTVLDTAEGMIRISCENMAQAVKRVLVGRGRDPRDFIYASFGAAGPMHACFVADAMGIPKIIVPTHAGVASAFGGTAMDLRHDLERFYYAPLKDIDVGLLNKLFAELEREGRSLLAKDGVAQKDIAVTRSAQMRYVGQTFEVETQLPAGTITRKTLPKIEAEFHRVHKQEFGVSSDEFLPAVVSIGVAVTGRVKAPPQTRQKARGSRQKPVGSREVFFQGEWIETQLWNGETLGPGQKLAGPAVIDYPHACVVMPPAVAGVVDDHLNLLISL